MQSHEHMFNDLRDLPEALAILQGLGSGGRPLLSVILDTSISQVQGRAFLLFLRNASRPVRSEIEAGSPAELKQFDAAVERADRFLLHRLAPRHPGLALFVSTDPDFFMTVPLPDRPAQDIAWGEIPLLTPLLEALDEHERVAVALVDKRQARLFTVYLGALESHGELVSELTGKHAAGDWPDRVRSSQVRGGRHTPGTGGTIAWSGMGQSRQRRRHEEYVQQHLRDVASALMALRSQHPFDRLILAGPEEAVVTLRANLPRPLESRYAGSLALPIDASESDVLSSVLREAESIERQVELTDVQRLLEGVGTGGAVVGLEDTLDALHLSRIDRLVIVAEPVGDIWACSNCGRLVASGSTCPSCGSQLEHVDDPRERLIVDVLDQAGRIETVSGAAAQVLIEHGGVGAFTRF